MSNPEEPAPENSIEEAARRYDNDEQFRRRVNGESAQHITAEDIDFDALPPAQDID